MKKTIRISINTQLQQLCQLLNTTPEEVLQTFANDLSKDCLYTSGSDEREMASDYFLRCGYGMHLFNIEEQLTIFHELDRLRYCYSDFNQPDGEEYLKQYNRHYNELFKQLQQKKNQKGQ